MNPEDFDLAELLERGPAAVPSTGTVDDDDDPNDEREDENEPPVGKSREGMEAPDEFVKESQDPGTRRV